MKEKKNEEVVPLDRIRDLGLISPVTQPINFRDDFLSGLRVPLEPPDPGGSSEAEKLKKPEEEAASAASQRSTASSSAAAPPSFQFQSSLPNPDYGGHNELRKNLERVASLCQRLMDLMPTAAEKLVSIMQSVNRAMDLLKHPRGRFPAADDVSAGPDMKEEKMDAVKIEELHGSPPHPIPNSPRCSGDNPHSVRAELSLPQSTAELAEQPQAGGGSSGGGVQGPPRQLIHVRRGHATDYHSIAERLQRERITKRRKTLRELVPDANKVVLKLDLHDDEKKQKAMEVASTLHGIDSIAVDMKVEEMTVIGSVDPADVLSKLRDLFPLAEIVSPTPENTAKLPEISLEAPVCGLVDVMYKVPAKLDGLLRHSHMLPKGAEDEIPLIKQDLEVMVAVLHDYSNSGAENCAMMIKCLMKEVHELSYDIEDCIDQYENAVDSRSGPVFRIPRRLITRRKSKTSRVPKKLKQRLWMANKIREFSMRSQEALQRYSLFNPDAISTTSPSSSSTDSRKKICTASTRYDASFGPWHPTPYGESPIHPVGIDAPVSKLKVWLAKDGEQNVKVISIVGSGGIGKTTLANELYHTIGGQFECRAFVRTSQKPDIKRLLISILSQVRPHRPQHTWKVHNLISDIRTHLQDKRYLIIIDDVWSTSTWDIVSRSLPESNHCSRILITTETEDVALRCCAYDPKYVFMLKPLSNDDSRILFFNTAFGCQHECSPDLLEVSSNIIEKCGGLPLALVTIASVLASRMGKLGQWDYVNKSLGYGLRTNPTVDEMKQVLNLSCDNLPWHLKVCLLYLSMYQEDWIIWKDDLVKQWIAEGFICATEDEDKEEIARRYFDELISSRMIQPAHINYNDEVLSCTVHHMVLNLITHKSLEENFIIAIDHSQTTARLADKVRRLSLHFGNSEDATPPTNMRLSQLRTLAFFGVLKSVPSIMQFQLLQVLILELWGDEENMSFDLTRISELFRLRYFQVTSNITLELRTKMQGLQYLETLKIDARLSVVPSDFCLPSLLHLNLPAGTKLPDGISHMTSLCTLGYVDLSVNSKETVDSLGKLTNLQDLQLTYSAVPSGYLVGNMEFLGSVLEKLSNLKSLSLVSAGSSHLCITNAPYNHAGMIFSGDGLSSIACPPALLHRLEWPHICIFSSLPRWIGGLARLRILKIAVRELSKNDIDVLKKLPVLTVLSFYVAIVPTERIAFDRTGFLVLSYFEFRCTVPWLKFEANAMPNLWKLKLGFSAHGNVYYGAMPVGIENLSVLKEVSAKISCVGPEESNRMTAESALRNTLRMHPGRLRVQVQHVHEMFDDEDDKSSVTKEDPMAFKQCDILEKDTSEQHAVLQKNSAEDVNKQADSWGLPSPDKGTSSTDVLGSLAGGEATGYKAKAPVLPYHNPSEEPPSPFNHRPGDGEWMETVQYSSMLVMDGGHRWRMYGQVKRSQKMASYYKCTFRGCPARKELSRSPDSQMTDVIYTGTHNHYVPQNTDMGSSRVLQSSHEASKRPVSGDDDDTFEGPPSQGAEEQARSFQAISQRRRLAENIEVPVNPSVSFSDSEVFADDDDGEVHTALSEGDHQSGVQGENKGER